MRRNGDRGRGRSGSTSEAPRAWVASVAPLTSPARSAFPRCGRAGTDALHRRTPRGSSTRGDERDAGEPVGLHRHVGEKRQDRPNPAAEIAGSMHVDRRAVDLERHDPQSPRLLRQRAPPARPEPDEIGRGDREQRAEEDRAGRQVGTARDAALVARPCETSGSRRKLAMKRSAVSSSASYARLARRRVRPATGSNVCAFSAAARSRAWAPAAAVATA